MRYHDGCLSVTGAGQTRQASSWGVYKHIPIGLASPAIDKIHSYFFLPLQKPSTSSPITTYLKPHTMTNIRQAKKLRSSRPKATAKRNGRLKSGKKKVNVLGNAIIAENWYASLTPTTPTPHLTRMIGTAT